MHGFAQRRTESGDGRQALVDRLLELAGRGTKAELVLAWLWLWERAGCQAASVSFRMADMAGALCKSDRAADENLRRLKNLGLLTLVEPIRGRYGHMRAQVEDPFDDDGAATGNAARELTRLEADPQGEFPFTAQDDSWAEETAASSGDGIAAPPASVPFPASAPHATPQGATSDASALGRVWCDGAVDERLTAALVAALGTERFDLWLGTCRLEWLAPRLIVTCPSDFYRKSLLEICRREIKAVLRARCDEAELDLVVDEDLPTRPVEKPPDEGSAGKAKASARQTSLLFAQQTNERTLSKVNERTNELKEFLDEKNSPFDRGQRRGLRLLLSAAHIYERIGDTSLFQSFAFTVAVHLEQGTIDARAVDRLVDDCREHGAAMRMGSLLKKHDIPTLSRAQIRNTIREEYRLVFLPEWEKSVEQLKRGRPR